MIVYITGINGFLGSHLARYFSERGHSVYGNDSFLCSEKGNYEGNVSEIDCCDFDAMAADLKRIKPDVVYHCAATAHEGLSVFSPAFITKNNYQASISVFSAAISAGVKKIIFLSSMARYGKNALPFSEIMKPYPVDPYGIAKVAAEDTLRVLAETHGIDYLIAVPHNIIGVGQKYNDPFRNVASIMLHRAKLGLPYIIYGDGMQKRCFSPVRECVYSLYKMATYSGGVKVFNIGPDHEGITINALADLCDEVIEKKNDRVYLDARPREVKEAWCSCDPAKRVLGYKPRGDIKKCLAEMYEAITTKSWDFSLPLEIITDKTPKTWKDDSLWK